MGKSRKRPSIARQQASRRTFATDEETPRSTVSKASGEGRRADSLAQLTHRNIELIAELEQAADAQRNPADRLADLISHFVGSMSFVYIHVLWFGTWILLNIAPILPERWRIDPFPFTFLTFVVSLEAIFLSTFILISQNHEEHLAQRRNHLDLQINLLSEQENSQILKMLESIARRLGIRNDSAGSLAEPTKPDELVNQIEKVIENGNS